MNYLRAFISKNKYRFIDRKYNLDLSYITPRIISMAYPGSGIQGLIRNNINDVSNFLKERHGNNYLVINLSYKSYDNSKFNNNVSEYKLVDHHAPSLSSLFEICQEIHKYLTGDINNVVAVNCRAGKGRTGTVICCYLLYTGRFSSPDEVFTYYSIKRFFKGEGVTQPSQRRYVEYFYLMLTQNKRYFPYRIKINSITIKDFDKSNRNGQNIYPFCDFYYNNSDKITSSTKGSYFKQRSVIVMNNTACITDSDFSYEVAGDVTIKISLNEMFFIKKLGKISFNTAFLDKDQTEIIFHANEVDPQNLIKKKKVPDEYKIILKIQKECDCDNTKTPIALCDKCKSFLKINNSTEIWEKIIRLANNYHPMDRDDESSKKRVKFILFGDVDIDDIDYILKKEKKIDSNEKLDNIKKDNDNKINDNEKVQGNDEENEEDENIEDNENSDDVSYDESSEEEESDEDDNIRNIKRKKKKKLNDSFESECEIY